MKNKFMKGVFGIILMMGIQSIAQAGVWVPGHYGPRGAWIQPHCEPLGTCGPVVGPAYGRSRCVWIPGSRGPGGMWHPGYRKCY